MNTGTVKFFNETKGYGFIEREDKEKDVLGSCVTLIGNSPSNLHFFATDTKRHFISGSLLFSAAPNYDSLAPAIGYIRNDVQKMLETLRWQ